jgi:hypothetical protein
MSNSTACQLLVSANTLDECILLQALNVPWIDLKEPRHGPLGRPELPLVKQFANRMTSASSSKAHWSIAGGELPDWNPQADQAYLEAVCLRGTHRTDGHIKWGLAHAETANERILSVQKTRLGRAPGRYRFIFEEDSNSFSYLGHADDDDGASVTQEEKIRLWMHQENNRGIAYAPVEISERCSISQPSTRRALQELWS